MIAIFLILILFLKINENKKIKQKKKYNILKYNVRNCKKYRTLRKSY